MGTMKGRLGKGRKAVRFEAIWMVHEK